MKQAVFTYTRSKRSEAIRVGFVSIAVIAISLFCLSFLPNIKGNELNIIYAVLALIFVGMWGFLVIPNLLKKGRLRCSIDEDVFECDLPDGTCYRMRIEQIDHVLKSRSMTRDQYVDYWITSKSGENILIPAIFGLSPESVLKALKKVKPQLEVKKKTGY